MANPQVENGHIKIANEIGEALCRINLSAYESRVLWVLFRKTYGWNKKEDSISFTQYAKISGISEPNIARTIKQLKQRNILTMRRNHNSNLYQFQKNYELWDKTISKETLSGEILSKETLSSETLSKNTTDIVSLDMEDIVSLDNNKRQLKTIYKSNKEIYKEKLSNIAKCYENNIGQLTPIIAEKLQLICDTYPDGWFEDAVKEALNANVRKMNYIEKILDNWQVNGRNNGHKGEQDGKCEGHTQKRKIDFGVGKPLR